MKTNEEIEHYRRLRSDLIAISHARNVKWATYYANLLGIGGQTPEQVFRNFFNDDIKKFNGEQLAIIYNDLQEHKDIQAFTQCEMQNEVLKVVSKIGKITEKMQKHFDDKDDIELEEIIPLVPEVRELYSLAKLLNLRTEETRSLL
jgi:septum formation topological specificity factor MinE